MHFADTMLRQQKIEKIVHFFEHQYFMNQCMFFADFLVKCYPLDTQKPKPKFFDNSYIFHNGRHLYLHKKIFPLPMYFVDTAKGKYYYFHFKVSFRSAITLEGLRLAVNSERNFSYLHSMFPRGKNYANLC